jgi:hypothetical protein
MEKNIFFSACTKREGRTHRPRRKNTALTLSHFWHTRLPSTPGPTTSRSREHVLVVAGPPPAAATTRVRRAGRDRVAGTPSNLALPIDPRVDAWTLTGARGVHAAVMLYGRADPAAAAALQATGARLELSISAPLNVQRMQMVCGGQAGASTNQQQDTRRHVSKYPMGGRMKGMADLRRFRFCGAGSLSWFHHRVALSKVGIIVCAPLLYACAGVWKLERRPSR